MPGIPYSERCPDCREWRVLLPAPDGRRLCIRCRDDRLRPQLAFDLTDRPDDDERETGS
jgi:hypothetical protein